MKLKKIAALVAIAAASGSAMATNGYFSHGYGMKAKGMGGAATAMASDAMGGANNPASMVWAGDRLDVGLDLFSPIRSASRTGSVAGTAPGMDGKADSGSNLFYVPEFGINRMVRQDLSLGVTVYGNGGMNTDYPGNQNPGSGTCNGFASGGNNLLCGRGSFGVDLVQLIVAPTVAMKVSKDHSLGASLLVTHQQFGVKGIESFAGFSIDSTKLSNNGRDKSNGVGLRLGWMGQLTDQLSVGAAYSMKTRMTKFGKYKGLFAGEGGFDIPENWNIGLAYKLNDAIKIAADYQRINYSDVPSIGNPSTNGGAAQAGTLGCPSCRGFGWSDVDVLKFGIEYQYNKDVTLRAGYNHSNNPIQSRDVTFNMLAPGVVQDHFTLGFTYGMSKDLEMTMAYMHAPKKSVSGASLFGPWVNGVNPATEKIEMYQNSLGVSFGLKF